MHPRGRGRRGRSLRRRRPPGQAADRGGRSDFDHCPHRHHDHHSGADQHHGLHGPAGVQPVDCHHHSTAGPRPRDAGLDDVRQPPVRHPAGAGGLRQPRRGHPRPRPGPASGQIAVRPDRLPGVQPRRAGGLRHRCPPPRTGRPHRRPPGPLRHRVLGSAGYRPQRPHPLPAGEWWRNLVRGVRPAPRPRPDQRRRPQATGRRLPGLRRPVRPGPRHLPQLRRNGQHGRGSGAHPGGPGRRAPDLHRSLLGHPARRRLRRSLPAAGAGPGPRRTHRPLPRPHRDDPGPGRRLRSHPGRVLRLVRLRRGLRLAARCAT